VETRGAAWEPRVAQGDDVGEGEYVVNHCSGKNGKERPCSYWWGEKGGVNFMQIRGHKNKENGSF